MGAHKNRQWQPVIGVSKVNGLPSSLWRLLTVTTGSGEPIHTNDSTNEIHEIYCQLANGNAGAQTLGIAVLGGGVPGVAEFSVSFAANSIDVPRTFWLMPGQTLHMRPTTGSVFRLNTVLFKHALV